MELNFDATNVPPDMGIGDPVPAGWYDVAVDETEIKPTSDTLGTRLAVRFTILDGQYAGRKIFTGFNIRNANPVAQEISFKQLSALAHAVGVLNVKDTQQLHGIPLKVRVKIKPAKDGYEPQNEITMYKNANESTDSTTPGAAGAPAIPATPAGFAKPATPAAPAPTNLTPAAPMMTTAATFTYQQYRDVGWSDEQLIAGGLMVARVPPVPASAPAAPAPTSWPANGAAPAPAAPAGPPALTAANPAATAGAAVPPWQKPAA
jgi:hypothetical protein